MKRSLKLAAACAALAWAGKFAGTRVWVLVAGAAVFFVLFGLAEGLMALRRSEPR